MSLGLTQVVICGLAGTSQSSLCDLLAGKTIDPRTTTGLRLIGLAIDRGVVVMRWHGATPEVMFVPEKLVD